MCLFLNLKILHSFSFWDSYFWEFQILEANGLAKLCVEKKLSKNISAIFLKKLLQSGIFKIFAFVPSVCVSSELDVWDIVESILPPFLSNFATNHNLSGLNNGYSTINGVTQLLVWAAFESEPEILDIDQTLKYTNFWYLN